MMAGTSLRHTPAMAPQDSSEAPLCHFDAPSYCDSLWLQKLFIGWIYVALLGGV